MLFSSNKTFCDWLTVNQDYPNGCPVLNDGLIIDVSPDGEARQTTHKSIQLKGSYSTSMQIRANGSRISISGNPSRYNRPDNVYGYDLDTAKQIFNQILFMQNLPPFTETAHVSRIDMATIASTGSKSKLHDFMLAKSKLNIPRYKISRKFNTLYWGGKSKTKTIKLYDKAEELRKHLKKSHAPEYVYRLIQHLDNIGAFRIETCYRYRYLKSRGFNTWETATQENLYQHFKEDIDLMATPVHELNIDHLTGSELGTLMIYLAGIDPKTRLAKNTFYKHKAKLLEYGYDISASDVLTRIETKPTLITLSAPAPPDWYKLPKSFKQLKLA